VAVEAVLLEVVQPHQLTLTPAVQVAVVPVRSLQMAFHLELRALADKVAQVLVVIAALATLTLKPVAVGVATKRAVHSVFIAGVMVVLV
jgi:hypothetical protein